MSAHGNKILKLASHYPYSAIMSINGLRIGMFYIAEMVENQNMI
jgi:hypothetical protein